MGFHEIGFLIRLGLLFCFAQLFDKAHRLAAKTAVESAAGTRMHDISKLFRGEVKKSVDRRKLSMRGRMRVREDALFEVDSAVGELAESSLFLQL